MNLRILLGASLAFLAAALIAQIVSPVAPTDHAAPIRHSDELYDPIVAGETFTGGIKWVVSRDGIPPIYEPSFLSALDSMLDPGDLVLGVEAEGRAKAYPIGLLAAREMVNDSIAGTPILVSWCPLCGTGTVHERTIDGVTVRFGNQGALWGNAMTWFDHETGSIWSQPLGKAIAGPLQGTRLELLRSDLTTWGKGVDLHPETSVLDGPVYWAGVTPQELLLVVEVDNHIRAYPLAADPAEGVWNDEVGGQPVAVVSHGDLPAGRAVYASDPGGRTLTLSSRRDILIDHETGSRWDPVRGFAISGPLTGWRLERLATATVSPADFKTFWPDGSIFGAPHEAQPPHAP